MSAYRRLVRHLPALAALACLSALVALAPAAMGQQREGSGSSDLIEMNFKNVDVVNFLQIMSTALNVAMVWDETKIRGNITLVSPQKFSRQDALRIFETVLTMHGFTTIQHPGSPLVQVVPTTDAPRIPSPTRPDGEPGEETNFFLTQIIPLKFADANQVRAALTPLISKSAGLAVYAPGNVMVLSDTEANIKRLLNIIKIMDVPPADIEYAVIILKFASALKMAPILTTLGAALPTAQPAARARGRAATPQARKAAGAAQFKVVADDRTNTLILVGAPRQLDKFREIIATLDVPGVLQERGVKVYFLEHADATELVKILRDVDIKPETKEGKPQQQATRAELGKVTLTADKATNALILFGPSEVIATMDAMVAQLDIRRPQVYVEVLIMEITLEKSLQLGVRWQATGEVSDGIVGAGFPDAVPGDLETALARGSGSAIGILGDEITFAGENFISFSGFIQATAQDTDVKVLANPQLLTLNNQEAEINVSQVIPVSTRTVTSSNLQTTTEFEFKDVGIILKITPQITGKDKVRLVINQESSSIAAKQVIQNIQQQAITTLKRKISTQVVVDNNTTVAIGGLIQDQIVLTETKIPCLGDIPLLGWLFKSTSEDVRKTNLIVFIRPRIINSRGELEETTERVRERYDSVRQPEADAENMLRESFGLPERPAPESESTPEAGEDQQ